MKNSINLKAAVLKGVVTYLYIRESAFLKADKKKPFVQTLKAGGLALILGSHLEKANRKALELDKLATVDELLKSQPVLMY